MSKNVGKMSKFVWSTTRLLAAEAIARDENRQAIADRLGVNPRTIERWQKHPDFQLKISEIILEIDITLKSERIKIAKQVIEKKLKDAQDLKNDPSSKDLLEWLKYVGSEMGDYAQAHKIDVIVPKRKEIIIASDEISRKLVNELLMHMGKSKNG